MTYPRQSDILAEFYDRDVAPEYLHRGTWAGDCADYLAMGMSLSPARLAMGEAYGWMGFIDSYRALINSPEFKSRFKHCIDVQQEVVNDAERYRGTYDQRWMMVDQREAIVDIKTGAYRKCVALQLCAYDLGAPLNQRRRRFSIHLTADKPGKLVEYTDSRDFDAFRLAVRWYHRRRDYL